MYVFFRCIDIVGWVTGRPSRL